MYIANIQLERACKRLLMFSSVAQLLKELRNCQSGVTGLNFSVSVKRRVPDLSQHHYDSVRTFFQDLTGLNVLSIT